MNVSQTSKDARGKKSWKAPSQRPKSKDCLSDIKGLFGPTAVLLASKQFSQSNSSEPRLRYLRAEEKRRRSAHLTRAVGIYLAVRETVKRDSWPWVLANAAYIRAMTPPRGS